MFFEKVIENGIDLGLISNGALMKKGFADIILKAAWCRFSIDAGNKKTYSKIREVPEKIFDKVLKNIKELTDKKKRENSNVVIGTSFIVTDQNYLEVYRCAKLMNALGVNYFRIGYYRTDTGFAAGDYNVVMKQIKKAQNLILLYLKW